ncbi:acetate--CoA ligase [Bergeyella zoohelcum]|uniref:Acetate--CoA ligase n=1 Tax=Bergeyella zoohelcum ATCC 43767 TaxID=883096 RepID=K1LVS5_9FLAO|nr:acetate--CoA ligase [Bergeyella zoohelcum]EKB54173.1 acetate-CoA ligase [Bergeyella zoohelcum ATCC 43767]SUV49940.1 Acetyl-coenzyme A synthetase [Bergeyella zoohelcum]
MRKYQIQDLPDYFKQYKKSIKNPKKFWDKIADENFVWYQRWSKVVDFDMENAHIKWFKNAKLNITKNCLDRHLNERGEKTAIIWEPNNPNEQAQYISYRELHSRVCKMANVLTEMGVQKGDRVCIYLPMIPEIAVAMLACAKMGAVHSVIFAGFSASAVSSRVNDCGAKVIITSDGSYRGNKSIDLKSIIDEAVEACLSVKKVLVVKRTGHEVTMKEGRDFWLAEYLDKASNDFVTKIMDAEDPLFILYTSGSTGKPKGMLHTTAGYMVYTGYTFQNVFDYRENDVHWCSADVGWITGHSYIIYGPLINGATTVIFEGVPTYPEPDRFWEIIEKHKVTQFYTAPTAIRSLAKESIEWVEKHDLSSLRVIGSVGEPINDEAWHWFNTHIGKKKCPILDTWWQTETGGIMISPIPFVTPTKPTYATLPLPGIQPVLMDEKRNEISGNQVDGNLCIRFPWPGIARTIWGDHERYRATYFSAFPGKYFTGDGALRDETGYYRITGRVDDVIIVSGHNLGTAPIEDSVNLHPAVAESAIVGYPHDIKGNALYGFVMLKEVGESRDRENLRKEINQVIAEGVGPIAKLDKIQFVSSLPKTRSGKIMRRILRKIAEGDFSNFGDTSTLINPEIINEIQEGRI